MLLELTQAFDFQLVVKARWTAAASLSFERLPAGTSSRPDAEGKVPKGMQGRLWIDKETFQWIVIARVFVLSR
jgi:hypothetical protein